MIWTHCPPQQNSIASVRELYLDRYLSPWRDLAGKTYQQTRLLDAPHFPNNNFPQQKCWFKLFMLMWVQDKVMWFLEPPHQVMNDVVMKRKFLAHCTANKDRIVKPLVAVLSSASPYAQSDSQKSPAWRMKESFEHHLTKLLSAKHYGNLVTYLSSDIYTPASKSGHLTCSQKHVPLNSAVPCICVLGQKLPNPLGNYPGAWWNTFPIGWQALTLLTSKQRWIQRG